MLLQSVLVAVDMKEVHGKPQASYCSKEAHLTLHIAHGLVLAGSQGGVDFNNGSNSITLPITLSDIALPLCSYTRNNSGFSVAILNWNTLSYSFSNAATGGTMHYVVFGR